MGQNIGTCVTALISSFGANKNGKRAAMVHLYFNIIGVVLWLTVFGIVNAIFKFEFVNTATNMWDIAIIHTVFKVLCVIAIAPFYKLLEKISILTIKDKENEDEKTNLLDERLFETPSIAASSATTVAASMAEIACEALAKSLTLFDEYDPKIADEVRDLEDKADVYEDAISSYLVKLSACDMTSQDSVQVTKLLHIIGDFERISDHAVNIVESAEEMNDKKIIFSPGARNEIAVLRRAVGDIVVMTQKAFVENDILLAEDVEPLEEVVDDLRDRIKLGHILRLQKSECTIEHGFILSDILNNLERVSDHCSNIAGCVVEISEYDALDMHKYIDQVKHEDKNFAKKVEAFKAQYPLS
jgi:phosphate:Na+ symporter